MNGHGWANNMTIFEGLKQTFIEGQWYNNTIGLDPGEVAIVSVPNALYRVAGIHKLTDGENGGQHHLFFDIWDESGNRVRDVPLVRTNHGGNPLAVFADKPDHETPDIPIWAGEVLTLTADQGEGATGIRTDFAGQGPGNTWGHHSYFVGFQKVILEPPPPPPPPVPGQAGTVSIQVNKAYLEALPEDVDGNITLVVPIMEA